MSIACLNNIIGLTRSTCAALTENLGNQPETEWYKKSESGLYLDELPGIVSIKALEQSLSCQTELADFYQISIESSKTQLRDDLIIGISSRYKQAGKNFIGIAGGRSHTTTVSLSGTYGGILLNTTWVRGGKLKIKGIIGVFQTPPAKVSLYRITMGATPEALEFVKDIDTSAFTPGEKYLSLAQPEELDVDGYKYAILYENAGVTAYNTNVSCGCGASEIAMKRYVSLVGLNGSDLSNLALLSQTNTSNGIALDIEAGCDANNVLCEVYEAELSYRTVIAHSIRFKAAELVTEKVLGSEEINRFTMMSREYLWGKRNHFQAEYNNRINWMVENLDVTSVSDCFVCNHAHKKVNKGRILV